jgi:hypothetical protein
VYGCVEFLHIHQAVQIVYFSEYISCFNKNCFPKEVAFNCGIRKLSTVPHCSVAEGVVKPVRLLGKLGHYVRDLLFETWQGPD